MVLVPVDLCNVSEVLLYIIIYITYMNLLECFKRPHSKIRFSNTNRIDSTPIVRQGILSYNLGDT